MKASRFFLFAVLCLSSVGQAQQRFSGRLVYEMHYESDRDDMDGIDVLLPKTCTVLTDASNWRMTQSTEINGAYIMIYKAAQDSIYEMLEVGPDRVQIGTVPKPNNEVWLVTNETKMILGKNTIGFHSQDPADHPLVLWLNEEFYAIPNFFLDGMQGIPMEFEQIRGGMRIRYTLVDWIEEPLDETYFALPTSYDKVSQSLYQSWLR